MEETLKTSTEDIRIYAKALRLSHLLIPDDTRSAFR